MNKQPPKFNVGDRVLFLGSEKSCYGINHHSDVHKGSIVTIKERHPTGYPYAYLFVEFDRGFYFSENCFEFAFIADLPEFEANFSIEDLF